MTERTARPQTQPVAEPEPTPDPWADVEARAAQAARLLAQLRRDGVGTRTTTRHYWTGQDWTAREHLADAANCLRFRSAGAKPTDLLGRIQSGAASARRALRIEAQTRPDLAEEADALQHQAAQAWTRAAHQAREAARAQAQAWIDLHVGAARQRADADADPEAR